MEFSQLLLSNRKAEKATQFPDSEDKTIAPKKLWNSTLAVAVVPAQEGKAVVPEIWYKFLVGGSAEFQFQKMILMEWD